MKEKFERFKNEKIVINVRSQKQYDDFMKMCEEQGLKWSGGNLPTKDNVYNSYKENTCINLNNLMGLSYCDTDYFKNKCYKIITYKDFIKEEKQDKFSGIKWYTNGVEIASSSYEGIFTKDFIKEPILDEVEKKWLKNFIKSTEIKVNYIVKYERIFDNNREYLHISFGDGDYVYLPCFKKNTMYKNMEVNKEYTLKELGLDK